MLKVSPLKISGAFLVESTVLADERGSFSRWYCDESLKTLIHHQPILQINHSVNKEKATFRGFHLQLSTQREFKIVRCIKGSVVDILVDLREGSEHLLQNIQVSLDCPSKMLIIPPGCAHGFQTLEADSQLLYLHTASYAPEHELAVRYDDPLLNISLPLPISRCSQRDQELPYLPDHFIGVRI